MLEKIFRKKENVVPVPVITNVVSKPSERNKDKFYERLVHLKVKIKSLAAEAVIIRQEARKTKGMAKWCLNDHRTSVVRHHSRHNLLAYGCLRGVPYEKMESKCEKSPNFGMIFEFVKRFGDKQSEKDFVQWRQNAVDYLKEKSNLVPQG